MLKKCAILSSVALLAIGGQAFAADLPSRMAPPVYVPPPLPVFTWTGFYVGVNAGYAFDYGTRTRATGVPLGVPTSLSGGADGFTGGGQIGYNYQIGGIGGFGVPGMGVVAGIEADAAYTDLDRRDQIRGRTGAVTTFRPGLDYLGTVRGRLGLSFNQFLVYGTGGFAYGGVNDRVSTVGGITPALFGSRNSTETGFAYGGGIEYALPTNSFLNFFKASAITLKAEYLHYDLGHTNVAVRTAAGTPFYTARFNNDGDLARAGLNYKFGSY